MSIKQLQTLRSKIVALQSDRDTIVSQKFSRVEVAEHVHRWAQDLHAEFTARAGTALRRVAGGDTSNGLAGLFRGVPLQHGGTDLAPGLVGLVGAEQLAQAVLPNLGDAVPPGLSAAERAEHLAAIDAELDKLERQEEGVIEALEAAGSPIARRRDARPSVVLALPGAQAA